MAHDVHERMLGTQGGRSAMIPQQFLGCQSTQQPCAGSAKMKSRGIFRAAMRFTRPLPRCRSRRSRPRSARPAYVYDARSIRARLPASSTAALAGVPHALHYALKANSTLAVARLLRELGSGADANSVGEIEVALRAGFDPSQIVFTGVGKTSDELERAIVLGVKTINAESPGELERIARDRPAAADDGARRPAGEPGHRRAKPPAHLHRPPHQQVRRPDRVGARRSTARRPRRRGCGPSACTSTSARRSRRSSRSRAPPQRIVALVDDLRADGIAARARGSRRRPRHLLRRRRRVPSLGDYAAAIVTRVAGTGLTLVLEPGRALVGAAGVLLTRVVDVKEYRAARGSRFWTPA